jgi:translation initiation factor RLI1
MPLITFEPSTPVATVAFERSGGELQRVQIAVGLAQEAPVLIADEPTSHLDLGAAAGVARLLRGLADVWRVDAALDVDGDRTALRVSWLRGSPRSPSPS